MTMRNFPLAYFITIRTYGTWLHGDERSSTSRFRNNPGQPRHPPKPDMGVPKRDKAQIDAIHNESRRQEDCD